MILYNLYFLKSNNGMLHYFKDYADPANGLIILNKKNSFLSENLNQYQIRFASNIFHLYVILLLLNYDKVFTPTPHPLPFIRRQVIVFHDLYPFYENKHSALKRLLIFIATRTTILKIGHINHSIKERIKKFIYLPNSVFVYMPNFPPLVTSEKYNVPTKRDANYKMFDLVLTGTDCRKKNYDQFFQVISSFHNSEFRIGIYGAKSSYIQELMLIYDNLKIDLVDPNMTDLIEFLLMSKRLVSVAKGEGFARPIALALQLGIPVDVIDDPVFRDFYDGLITFHYDTAQLIQACIADEHYLPSQDKIDEFYSGLLSEAHNGKNIALNDQL